MKKTIFFITYLFIFSVSALAQTIQVDKMPNSVEEFVTLRDQIAKSPQGGVAMFVLALKLCVDNPSVGEQCLVIAVDRSRLQQGSIYKGFQLFSSDNNRVKRQLNYYPYVVNSYFKGANPENGYTATLPYVFNFSSNAYSGDKKVGKFKIFVKCYGADSPRPIKLVKNNKGYWKAVEWSSIIMGIKKPVVKIDDDL